jgi:hypothetical protein
MTITRSRRFYPARPAGIPALLCTLIMLVSCHPAPEKRYGFLTMLGRDTISVESIIRQDNTLISDEVDRFPRVHTRHTVVNLNDDGSIRHLEMDIHTPSEPSGEQHRKVVADVAHNNVHLSKTDSTATVNRDFPTGGSRVVAHVPQMYSLYELYFQTALTQSAASKQSAASNQSETAKQSTASNQSAAPNQSATSKPAAASKPAATAKPAAASKPATSSSVELRQFYIDREFDRFPLGHATVTPVGQGKAEVTHDWLAGAGEAMMDSAGDMLSYSGARTTYKVEVKRLATAPDVKAIAAGFEAKESAGGSVRSLSVRDSVRTQIGNAMFTIDYSRPLARGRTLLGDVIPYDRVWRTGANAATQFTTSTPIRLGGMQVPAGAYTLFTAPHPSGVDLIVNKQTGEWGTDYNGSLNLGMVRMTTEAATAPVEEFTISVIPADPRHGKLVLEWGAFRWSVPIEVQ